ncbi:MAG: MFS transporter [Pseudomonadota bacterium]
MASIEYEGNAAGSRRARRNVAVLATAQAILGAQMPINFVMGGLAGQYLAPNPILATLPISMIVLGSMVAAPLLANHMEVHGRRSGFLLGALGGGAGAALMAAALIVQSFPLMLAGAFFVGLYMSAQGYYRFAAADTASAAFRPKAISFVMAGGLIGAILGPQLFKLTNDVLAPVPFAGAYLAVMVLNLLAVPIFAFLDIPPLPKAETKQRRGRTRLEMLRTPRILVAMICGMVSYALMNLVMTSTPLAVVGCGLTEDDAANLVSVHVLAMFIPSFFTGHLIARFGVERIIALGLVILAGSGLAGLSGVAMENFLVGTILLGLGWNFGYIGATAMIAASHTPEERARLQGTNDFAVFGMVTLASLSSGFLMNGTGGTVMDGWSAVNYAMIPFLVLAGGALVWFALQKPSPTAA